MRLPSLVDEAILAVVMAVPVGRLMSYGDVAMIAADMGYPCGPRQVARALSDFGDAAPWWRVVQSAGTLAEPVADRARVLLAADGVAVDGRRVPLDEIRWRPEPGAMRSLAAQLDGGGYGDSVRS